MNFTWLRKAASDDHTYPCPVPTDERSAPRRPVFAASKFHAPGLLSTLVARPALLKQLDAADALPLAIVVGAPGSGKTSLLAEWYHAFDDGSIAWMSADAGDADPTRFW